MLVKVLDDYSGKKVNAKAVSNPTSQYGAGAWNRAHEDLAQTTRTIDRAIVSFLTVNSGDPLPINTQHRSVWGVSGVQKPIVTRLSIGLYLATYGTQFDDGLGLDDSIEDVTFAFAPIPSVMSANTADLLIVRAVAFTANTFTLALYADGGAGFALADFGNASAAGVTVTAKIV